LKRNLKTILNIRTDYEYCSMCCLCKAMREIDVQNKALLGRDHNKRNKEKGIKY